jgi:hypothetical protein
VQWGSVYSSANHCAAAVVPLAGGQWPSVGMIHVLGHPYLQLTSVPLASCGLWTSFLTQWGWVFTLAKWGH